MTSRIVNFDAVRLSHAAARRGAITDSIYWLYLSDVLTEARAGAEVAMP